MVLESLKVHSGMPGNSKEIIQLPLFGESIANRNVVFTYRSLR
jgi:hypothetical protein